MRARHVKMIWHVPIVEGNTLHTRLSVQSGNWKKMVQQVKVERKLSFTEAGKVVESSSLAIKDKSYAAVVKVSTSNIAIQTDLT